MSNRRAVDPLALVIIALLLIAIVLAVVDVGMCIVR